MNETILRVENLTKFFPIPGDTFLANEKNYVKAVNGITFEVVKGECLGIVGESGCGKSTTGKLILQLIKPTTGKIFLHDTDLSGLSKPELRKMRRHIQMVFQDPYASLDPRQTVRAALEEPMAIHGCGSASDRAERVRQLLQEVGLEDYHADRYPHEFSGGQRQRINVARALALNPDVIICDEPVSALDVSIQAQVVNLLKDLQRSHNLTYIFIAHDLSVVKYVSDRIVVMYLGKIMEIGSNSQVYSRPAHPYTMALLSAMPIIHPRDRRDEKKLLNGDPPSPISIPQGCVFHPRCSRAMDICRREAPVLQTIDSGHQVACHLCPNNYGTA